MVEYIGGVTAYDSVYPSALLRITFQKAHWWHTAEQFADASLKVYQNLGPVAHLSPAKPFPLAGGATTWTMDARNFTDRTLADVVRALSAACNVGGIDYVEVASVQVLNTEAVHKSNTDTGAAERAMSSASATATAANNPGVSLGKAADSVTGIFGQLRTVVIVIAIILVLAFVLTRKS